MSTVVTQEPGAASTNDRPLEPGDVVGEYTVRDQLGKGGFGTVYRAIHPVIGKVVAIKVLARRYSADDAMVQRFVQEARAVNQIRHRHIIDIFSFGQLPDGRHYYVMEYLDGTPLDQYLKANGPLSLADALPILRAIARALDAAHAQGIAHRDLKPENIVLGFDDDGQPIPKLLDFGIAKLSTDEEQRAHRTGTGVPLGTPYYMSPEQCRGRDVDYRTDIYAFGVMCFRLLTGAYPFEGEVIDILHRHMHETPPAPSTVNRALDGTIDAAIAQMLAKDPAGRPATVLAAVSALTGEPATTPARIVRAADTRASKEAMMAPTLDASSSLTMPPPPREASPRSRRPMWIALVALVCAAGATVAFLATRDGDPAAGSNAPAIAASDANLSAAVDAMPIDTAPVIDTAVPSQVIVELVGAPDGAEVTLGATAIGFTPKVPVPYGTSKVVLTLRQGTSSAQVELVPDKDQSIDVAWKKRPNKVPTRPKNKDDIFRADQLPEGPAL